MWFHWPFITRVSLSLSFIICVEYHSIEHFIEWFFCPPRHVRSCVAYLLLSLPFPFLTVPLQMMIIMMMLWSVTMPLHESHSSSFFPLSFHSHEGELYAFPWAFALERVKEAMTVDHRSVQQPLVPHLLVCTFNLRIAMRRKRPLCVRQLLCRHCCSRRAPSVMIYF